MTSRFTPPAASDYMFDIPLVLDYLGMNDHGAPYQYAGTPIDEISYGECESTDEFPLPSWSLVANPQVLIDCYQSLTNIESAKHYLGIQDDVSALKTEMSELPEVPETFDDLTDGTTNKSYTETEKTKLSGIASGATANDTDANLKNRANHTGTQTADTISDFSTASQAVITALSGANNGLAPLDAGGKVAAAYLPSYVDDVLEYANTGAFPMTGDAGKIYVATGTGKIYRWSGSVYVEISASPGSTDDVTEGATNKYFTEARVCSSLLTGLSTASAADVAETDSILQAIGKLQAKCAALEAWKAATNIKRTESFSVTTDGNGDAIITFGTAVSATAKVGFIVDGVYSSTDHPMIPSCRAISTSGATIRIYRNVTLALLGTTVAPLTSATVQIKMIEFN